MAIEGVGVDRTKEVMKIVGVGKDKDDGWWR